MNALCLDVLHSDWHDWRGTEKDEDHLLKPGWLEQLVIQQGLFVTRAPDADILASLNALRALMQRIVEALLQKQEPRWQDLDELNRYLDTVQPRWHLVREDAQYQLQLLSVNADWEGVLGEVALSFARLLESDRWRIKQCENPACRWIFYDESANQSRRWCEDSCANLMRVRRFRARHQQQRNEKK